MELSSSNIKKILIFSQRKSFLIFSQKKTFLIFSQKKAFLMFPEMKPCTFWPQPSKFFPKKTCSEKISYIFSKESFSYISGNGALHFSPQA